MDNQYLINLLGFGFFFILTSGTCMHKYLSGKFNIRNLIDWLSYITIFEICIFNLTLPYTLAMTALVIIFGINNYIQGFSINKRREQEIIDHILKNIKIDVEVIPTSSVMGETSRQELVQSILSASIKPPSVH